MATNKPGKNNKMSQRNLFRKKIITSLNESLLEEQKIFHLDWKKLTISIKEHSPIFSNDYDSSYERAAYMYRYATLHTLYIKYCVSQFFSKNQNYPFISNDWDSHVNLCSLSLGPGLDYLAFNLAILERNLKPPVFKNVQLLSQYAAWRDTVQILADTIRKDEVLGKIIDFDCVSVLKEDVLDNFTYSASQILLNSDVVLMFKFLNLGVCHEGKEEILPVLNKLVSFVKPGAVVFFMDTMPSSSMMKEVLRKFHGHYMLKPTVTSFVEFWKVPKNLNKLLRIKPVRQARGMFFVWKKSIPTVVKVCPLTSVLQTIDTEIPENQNLNDEPQNVSSSGSGSNYSQSPTSELEGASFDSTCVNIPQSFVMNNVPTSVTNLDDQNVSSSGSGSSCFQSGTSELKGASLHSTCVNIPQSFVMNNVPTNPVSALDNNVRVEMLTNKINSLADSIVEGFIVPHNKHRNEDSITTIMSENLNAIENVTKRINRLITSLESNLNNRICVSKDGKML